MWGCPDKPGSPPIARESFSFLLTHIPCGIETWGSTHPPLMSHTFAIPKNSKGGKYKKCAHAGGRGGACRGGPAWWPMRRVLSGALGAAPGGRLFIHPHHIPCGIEAQGATPPPLPVHTIEIPTKPPAGLARVGRTPPEPSPNGARQRCRAVSTLRRQRSGGPGPNPNRSRTLGPSAYAGCHCHVQGGPGPRSERPTHEVSTSRAGYPRVEECDTGAHAGGVSSPHPRVTITTLNPHAGYPRVRKWRAANRSLATVTQE